jgi:hypothetical protein
MRLPAIFTLSISPLDYPKTLFWKRIFADDGRLWQNSSK